jgi:hypothetical protein
LKSRRNKKYRTKKRKNKRKTIFTPEEDLHFCIEFDLTKNKREKMKTLLRKKGIDLFSKQNEYNEFRKSIVPRDQWEYRTVYFLILWGLKVSGKKVQKFLQTLKLKNINLLTFFQKLLPLI